MEGRGTIIFAVVIDEEMAFVLVEDVFVVRAKCRVQLILTKSSSGAKFYNDLEAQYQDVWNDHRQDGHHVHDA